jgi:hypothetical protein
LASTAAPNDPEALLRAYLQSDHDLLARIQDRPEDKPEGPSKPEGPQTTDRSRR